MHGRVKTKSTEEQESAKKKERAEKVRLFREITNRIYEKRAAGERDDEALKLTRQVLQENPEIATFWNYRREIFLERFETMAPEEATKACETELSLLEYCLKVNPKAYCIWSHRQWVMTHTPSPDWKNEKGLCDLFLKYDERNFHCWDYRRFVVSKSPSVTLEDEFQFTYKKIAANFSNYSSWHYRSKLLPQLYPSPDKEGGVAEEALLKEHELVQNAFFTDPNDQSAWFYQRWLLGKVERSLAVACVLVRKSPSPSLCVVFNQPVKITESDPVSVEIGDAPVITLSNGSNWPESFHEFPLSRDSLPTAGGVVMKVKFRQLEAEVKLAADESEGWMVAGLEDTFGSSLTAATTTVLESELSSCKDLLSMEPDNKWCILTTALLMQALDPRKHFAEISEYLKQLCSVDPYREAYYRDLFSKFVMEQSLKECREQLTCSNRSLDLADKNLSRVFFHEHLILYKRIDLSRNQLLTLDPNIRCLVSVTELILDGNQLEQLPLEMASLRELTILSLKDNKISSLDSLGSLRDLKQLKSVVLSGNPVCETLSPQDLQESLLAVLPQLHTTSNSS